MTRRPNTGSSRLLAAARRVRPRIAHTAVALVAVAITSCTTYVLRPHVLDHLVARAYRDVDGMWIVDGDTPVSSEEELRAYYASWGVVDPENPPPPEQPTAGGQQGLVIAQHFGQDSRWSVEEKNRLTYCVSTAFDGDHGAVVTAMTTATGDWESAADIGFVHDTGSDANCTAANTAVVFRVAPNDTTEYLARAFFPTDGHDQRNLFVTPAAIAGTGGFTLEGVLRHELGHVLGFRHEHIRVRQPDAGTCFNEDLEWRGLTNYDANSVMHYPQCSGTNTGDLVLTAWDRQGAAAVYGTRGGGPRPEQCGNGLDDDLDGAVDDGCVEVCANGNDDDRDGVVDETGACPGPGPTPVAEACSNGSDDDLDSRVDEGCAETCNGVDDNADGAIDDNQACHTVVLRLSGIDDEAHLWIHAPGSPNDSICSARRAHDADGFAECDLSQLMRERGNPESSHFVLKFRNSGCFRSGGTMEVLVDGTSVFHETDGYALRHCNWFYRREFDVDFRRGVVRMGNYDVCEMDWSCPN
jgi:hypothetical protein